MKKLITLITIISLVGICDIFAKSYGGSRSFSSSRSSSSSKSFSSSKSTKSFSSKKATPAQKKATAAKQAAQKKATAAKQKARAEKKAAKKKAVAKSKMDKKLNKKMASTDKAAASKYGTKAKAESEYKSKLVSGNKYTSATAPTTRPTHIPQNVMVGGTRYNSVYGGYPGGGYGYGYYDPMGLFIAMTASQMMVDAHQMRMAGYGRWDASGQPIVYRPAPVGWYVFIGILIVAMIGGGIWLANKES